MKKLFTFLMVTFLCATTLLAQDEGDSAFVSGWAAPIPNWWPKLPAVEPVRNQAIAKEVASFDAVGCDFDAEWAKIPGAGNVMASQLGNNASHKGVEDFKDAAFKVFYDAGNMYILLQYTDDDVTGTETVEISWAPYLKINAPDIVGKEQAWYSRYAEFGAYKATYKTTGFDAAMVITGATGNVNWGTTNAILTASLFYDDHTVSGSKTIKHIYTIGYAALTGDARAEFNPDIWRALNGGKGITFDIKVNDTDADDALNTASTPKIEPAVYWWNTTSNDCYALTTYAGFLDASDPLSADAAFVAGWPTPVPNWWPKLPAVEPVRNQAVAREVSSFDAVGCNFDTEWAKIPGAGNIMASQLGNNASHKGVEDFKDAAFKVFYDAGNMYILLQYTDDDVTGTETVEISWAPYLKIDASDIVGREQAWYSRYKEFGAYKATYKTTGFDAAMVITGATANVNWGTTNDILTANLFYDDHTATGSKTIKHIYTIGYAALTGDARPEFNPAIWKALNEGKGITLDVKVNDVDADDALNTASTPKIEPAAYWWNTTSNDCYALTTYAGFLSAGDPLASADAEFVAGWPTPIPNWWPKLPAVEPVRQQAYAYETPSFDAVGCDFDAEWAKINDAGNLLASQLGNNASHKGAEDFKDAAYKVFYDADNMYILLQYTDDDVTGTETVEISWAPYLKIDAPDITGKEQAWYTRYKEFGAYKATYKATGFDAAMVITGATANVNWGTTNDILTANLFYDDHTAAGSKTIKHIYTIGYAALTGDARPEFNPTIWKALNEGKGITLDVKVNDVDADDALNTASTPKIEPAAYWWNTTSNDCYALTTYAGFLGVSSTNVGIAKPIEKTNIFGRTTPNRIELNKTTDVYIFNILGQPVMTKKGVNQIDLSGLKHGAFIIRANNQTMKFVR